MCRKRMLEKVPDGFVDEGSGVRPQRMGRTWVGMWWGGRQYRRLT